MSHYHTEFSLKFSPQIPLVCNTVRSLHNMAQYNMILPTALQSVKQNKNQHLTHWGRYKMAAICADNIFQLIFFNGNVWILIIISLKFVLKSPISNNTVLVQIMACRLFGDKPLSEPMMVWITDTYMSNSPRMGASRIWSLTQNFSCVFCIYPNSNPSYWKLVQKQDNCTIDQLSRIFSFEDIIKNVSNYWVKLLFCPVILRNIRCSKQRISYKYWESDFTLPHI